MKARALAGSAFHGAAQAAALGMCLAHLAGFVLQNPYQIPSPWLRAALVAAMGLAGWRLALPAVLGLFLLVPVSGVVHLGLGMENTALETIACALYLGWAARKAVRCELIGGEPPAALTATHGLILITVCSVVAGLCVLPADFAVYRILRTQPLSQLDPLYGYRAGLTLTLALCLFEMALREGASWFTGARLTRLLAAQAVLIATCAAAQLFFQYPVPRLPGLFSPFADIHSFAGYCLLLFVFFLALAVNRSVSGSFPRPLAAGLCGLSLAFVFLSNSRSSWLVAATALAAAALSGTSRRKALPWLAGGAACMVVLGAVFMAATKDYGDTLDVSMRHNLIVRVRNLIVLPADFLARKDSGEVQTLNARVGLWSRALKLGLANPATGAGVGSFYKHSGGQPGPAGVDAPGARQNAHNWYLQMFAELGLPGLALLAGLFWLGLAPALGRTGSSKEPAGRALALGLAAYLASCLAGHHLLINTQQYMVFFLLAGLAALLPEPAARRGWRVFILASVAAVAAYQLCLAAFAATPAEPEYGFYGREDLDLLERRWTMRKFQIPVAVSDRTMLLEFQSAAANIPGGRQRLKLYLDGRALGEIVFDSAGSRRLFFDTGDLAGKNAVLRGELDAAYNPSTRGAGGDNRDLGVLMSDVRFLPVCPAIPGNP
jgi:hypothetical protein